MAVVGVVFYVATDGDLGAWSRFKHPCVLDIAVDVGVRIGAAAAAADDVRLERV